MEKELTRAIVEEYEKGKELRTLIRQARETRLESIATNKRVHHTRADTVDNLFNAMFKGW